MRLKNNDFIITIRDFGVLALLNFLIYHNYWLLERLFTGADFFRQLVPLINFQSDCLKELSLPLWNPFMNFGYPWLDHYLSSFLFPTHLVIGFLSRCSVEIVQLEILGWRLFGGLGIYLCIIEQGHSRRAAIISAVSFMFSGQMMALTSWSNQIYNACCFPFLLLGYLQAKKSNTIFSFVAIVFLAMAILGGYIASSILTLYFFIGYLLLDSIISRKFFWGIKFLGLTLVLSFLLTLPKLVPLYLATETSPRLSLITSPNINFGKISYYELMSFFLPVKYYFSVYIGQLSVIIFFYALLKRKLFKLNVFILMFFLSAWLLIVNDNGSVSALRSAANSILPFMSSVRFEFLYWYYPLTFLILFLAQFLDNFFDGNIDKVKFLAVGIFTVLLTLVFLSNYNTTIYLYAYAIQLGLSLVWLFLIYLRRQRRLQTILIFILITVDFWIVFNRINIDELPVRKDDYLEIFLTHQNNTSRSFRDNELVRERCKIRITSDCLRPTLNESRQRPYLELGSEDSGPRLVNTVESMNQKRFTGVWYNAQEKTDFTRLRNDTYFREMQNVPLFFFTPTDPQDFEHSVSFDGISGNRFLFRIKSEKGGDFTLNQMYDKRWRVFVDDKESRLYKANGYFMGINLASGVHKLEFVFHDRYFNRALIVSCVTFIIILGFFIYQKLLTFKLYR